MAAGGELRIERGELRKAMGEGGKGAQGHGSMERQARRGEGTSCC